MVSGSTASRPASAGRWPGTSSSSRPACSRASGRLPRGRQRAGSPVRLRWPGYRRRGAARQVPVLGHELRAGLPLGRLSRRDATQFSRSVDPGIRSNYGIPCQGIRIPYTPVSTYELAAKLAYSFGTGSRVGLSYLRSQTQERGQTPEHTFDYANLYNTASLFGTRDWSDVLTLTWTPNLARSAERALALEVYLSYQQNRSISSPLTRESELATRAPFGGYLFRPLGFLFDFDNFPLDRELVENIRPRSPRQPPRPLMTSRTPSSSIWSINSATTPMVFRVERGRRPGRTIAALPGEPLHRQGQSRLAARPLQPAEARRRGHPVLDRALRVRAGGAGRRLSRAPGALERVRGGSAGSGRRGPDRRAALRQLRLPGEPALSAGHGTDQRRPSASTSTSGGADLRGGQHRSSTGGRWSSTGRTSVTATSARTPRCPFRSPTGPICGSPMPTRCRPPTLP